MAYISLCALWILSHDCSFGETQLLILVVRKKHCALVSLGEENWDWIPTVSESIEGMLPDHWNKKNSHRGLYNDGKFIRCSQEEDDDLAGYHDNAFWGMAPSLCHVQNALVWQPATSCSSPCKHSTDLPSLPSHLQLFFFFLFQRLGNVIYGDPSACLPVGKASCWTQ